MGDIAFSAYLLSATHIACLCKSFAFRTGAVVRRLGIVYVAEVHCEQFTCTARDAVVEKKESI